MSGMFVINQIDFRNFKALRNATLPLGRFALMVGPNGSGKTSAIQGLMAVSQGGHLDPRQFGSIDGEAPPSIEIVLHWIESADSEVVLGSEAIARWRWTTERGDHTVEAPEGKPLPTSHHVVKRVKSMLSMIRAYSFEADAIARPVRLEPNVELTTNGGNLAGVLDHLRDRDPDRFAALSEEFTKWIPEFDRILFETPSSGDRALCLRMRSRQRPVKIHDVSHGTRIALAILTLAYLAIPPSIVCLEEPDRGLHPRLLRYVRDALYRLSYPEAVHENREPVQVIATTHSPYFLDLYREQPEEVVICEKGSQGVTFERLSSRSDIEDILGDVRLGEAWYSGVLGGVPPNE